MIEKKRYTPPLEAAIEKSLLKEHEVHLELTADELEEIMSSMVEHLFQKSGVTTESTEVLVVILQNVATIELRASITKPVKATFIISYTLHNSKQYPGQLEPKDITITITASLLAKAAIKTQRVDEKIKYALNNINETIMSNPPPIIQERGLSFSDVSLTLKNDKLAVRLTSKSGS